MKKLFLVVLLTFLFSCPPIHLIAVHGVKALFGFFAEDAFYYLTVARNSTNGFFTTFDGETVTNGYHPLWQFLLIGLFKVVGPEQAAQLYSTFFLGYAFTLLGFIFTGLALLKCTRSLIAPFWLVPGIFSAFFEVKRVTHGITYSYSIWSSLNGMESSLSVFFGGILIYLLTPSRSSFAATGEAPGESNVKNNQSILFHLFLGCILACCVLSRLDDVFLLPAVAVYFLFCPAYRLKRFARIFFTLLPASVCLAVYMALNYRFIGTPLPISGQLKGGLSLWSNLGILLDDFLPLLRNAERYNPATWDGTANRNMAMVVPVLLAIAILLIPALRTNRAGKAPAALYATRRLTPLLTYIILKGLYNLAAVRLAAQGYWYWSLSILAINYALIVFFTELIRDTMRDEGRALWSAMSVIVWLFFYCHYSASVIYKIGTHNHWSYNFWLARDEIRKALTDRDPKIKLIDGFDGIVGYALELPTISGTGLVTDLAGLKAAKMQDYLDYCLGRGFNVLGHSTRPGGYVDIARADLIRKEIFSCPAGEVAFTHISLLGGWLRQNSVLWNQVRRIPVSLTVRRLMLLP